MSNETSIKKYFELSVNTVMALKTSPSSEEKLELYGLYKQSLNGNCSTAEPSKIFSPVENAKWNAWKKLNGQSKLEAMTKYTKLVTELIDKYGV